MLTHNNETELTSREQEELKQLRYLGMSTVQNDVKYVCQDAHQIMSFTKRSIFGKKIRLGKIEYKIHCAEIKAWKLATGIWLAGMALLLASM